MVHGRPIIKKNSIFNQKTYWFTDLTAGLYQLLEDSELRVIVFNGMNTETAEQIRRIRPVPTYCAILASGDNMLGIVQEVSSQFTFVFACELFMQYNFAGTTTKFATTIRYMESSIIGFQLRKLSSQRRSISKRTPYCSKRVNVLPITV